MANIRFQKTVFVTSASEKKQFLLSHPVVTVMGRSNVGKSTLINNLCLNSNLMKTSKKPGRTQLINYCMIDDKFYLADVPGYGFASFKRDNFEGMMKDFLEDNPALRKVYILIDSRRLLMEGDIEFASYLSSLGLPYSYIFTKCDKLNQSEKHFLALQIEKIKADSKDVTCFTTGMKQDESFSLLRKDMLNAIR